jgi:oligoendopeptidase F
LGPTGKQGVADGGRVSERTAESWCRTWTIAVTRTTMAAMKPLPMMAASGAAAAAEALPEWNLADLYAGMDSPQLAADLAASDRDCAAFEERFKGKLSHLADDDPCALATAIADYEAIRDRVGRIVAFASLLYAGDTSDPARAKFYGDVQQKVTDLSTHLLFLELELNRIDDAVMAGALSASPALAHYRPWLEDLRRERPHQLADEIERLFLERNVTARAAWNRLFDETMSALRFKVGENELTLEPTLNLLQDADEAKRKAGADALATTFKANLRVFTLITNTLAKDKEIVDRWHRFADIADARHLDNRVEREVVDALVAAVRAAYPRLSHRYYALKARWFGKDALEFWDRNAPLPKVPQKTYGWGEARDSVLGAYRRFSPDLAGIAQRFFDERWIDAPVRPGKAPGAFAHPTVPSAHPYILLNFQGKPRDVMTLAHELGHGVHQVLAAPQGALMSQTPLTLAETASVFGEMLTFRRLLGECESPAARKALLAGKVEDMINTVVRQIAFYGFERKVHEARKAGELTAEALCEAWLDVQRESLGPAVRLGAGYEAFWVYIPHFVHAPFYVYAYAFGDCLVNSLYAVYETTESGFVDRYVAMLSAGGSKHHSELLAPFGLDARDPGFWDLGLGLIDRMIGELETMA